MAVNSLFPAFIKLAYHSAYGAHSGLLAVREWSSTPLVPLNALGSFTNWAGFPCDGQEMVEDLTAALAAWNPATVVYDSATLYTMDSETAPAIPRAVLPLAVVGTNGTPGWSKATMRTWFFRDEEWSPVKIVQMDGASANNFDPTTDITGNVPAETLVGAFTSTSWAWASRNGLRPKTFHKTIVDLNDKSRAEYGMI